MKKLLSTALVFCLLTAGSQAQLLITGIVDGPRSGGTPKAIELYAISDIADLSIYNVETPNNGGAATGSEFALSGSVSAGSFLWIASEGTEFFNYFGFAASFTNGVANNNGDDNVILYQNAITFDQFGVNGQDGTGTPWDSVDGYAYRNNGTGPDATFDIGNWTFSGIDFLDSQGVTGVNGSDGKTVPFGTYSATLVPEPSTLALFGIFGVALAFFRRR